MVAAGELSYLEHSHNGYCCSDYGLPTIGRTYRSRVLEMRSERRRLRMERRLYEIYDRLSSLPDATYFVTRDLFLIYGIPEDVREEYVRTHKVVGPGALATYDYAVIFKGHENLAGPTDYTVRANGQVIYPLAVVLTYPDMLQGKLSAAEVVQLRRRAAINPNSAAVEAQNYIRRRTKGKEAVIVGELNRSAKACSRTIERFSVHMRVYDEPIESLVEGNWIQMFGPNGIRDWSIAAPIVRANSLKCLYRMIVTMGTDVVRLLFENEMALMGVVMVDYGDMISDPLQEWSPCGAPEQGYSSELVYEGSSHSPAISEELLAAGERETMDAMPLCLRTTFEDRKSSVLSVKSRGGNHLGNAVDLGGNALVTCSHVAEAAAPSTLNELSLRGITDHLHLLDGGGPWDSNCPIREAEVGELGVFVFVVDDEVRFSSPTVVLRKEYDHLVSSPNPIMGKGRSGCALFSLTDLCLLGIFTARLDDLLVSVKLNPDIKAKVYSVTREMSRVRCDNLYDLGKRKTREAVNGCFIDDGRTLSVCHPSGLIDCAVNTSQRIEQIHIQSRPAATVTYRDTCAPLEHCRLVLRSDGTIHESSVYTVRHVDSGLPIRFPNGKVHTDIWALLVSELDHAVLGFRLFRAFESCVQPNSRLEITRGDFNDVFAGQEQCSLTSVLGCESFEKVKVDLLATLSGCRLESSITGDNSTGDDSANYVSRLTDDNVMRVGSLFDYEFYLELVGERAIHVAYISDRQFNNPYFGTTMRKFIYLVLKFVRIRLGHDVYDGVLSHITLSSVSDPT